MFFELTAATAALWRQPAEPTTATLFREQYHRAQAAEVRRVSRPATDQRLAQRALADAVIAMARHMSVI